MSDPYVKQTIDKGIGYIEFFHPAHNSLPGDFTLKIGPNHNGRGRKR